jgi:peptide deformylase
MQHYGGLGLSANQVRLPYRVFVMKGSPPFVCFNPVLVEWSNETIKLEEGCLTFPGMIAEINRPKHIKVRFQTPSGVHTTKTFTGMTARIVQHEMEHLDGGFFFDGIGRMRMEKALKEAEKEGHAYRQFNLMKRAVG